MEQRERWREGIELMLKAWTAKELFAWNGKYYQLPKVNLWPRPVQDPHPPLLIPGGVSSSTWDYCHDRDLPYACLSYFGGRWAQRHGQVLAPRGCQGRTVIPLMKSITSSFVTAV